VCLAVPGQLVEIAEREGLRVGSVDFGGLRKEVCLEGVPDAAPGDYVLVHVGFALQVLDVQAAAEMRAAVLGPGNA
jgi:hydrogenase expression/formation protein HypC